MWIFQEGEPLNHLTNILHSSDQLLSDEAAVTNRRPEYDDPISSSHLGNSPVQRIQLIAAFANDFRVN